MSSTLSLRLQMKQLAELEVIESFEETKKKNDKKKKDKKPKKLIIIIQMK